MQRKMSSATQNLVAHEATMEEKKSVPEFVLATNLPLLRHGKVEDDQMTNGADVERTFLDPAAECFPVVAGVQVQSKSKCRRDGLQMPQPHIKR
jgi:hypothetical protein